MNQSRVHMCPPHPEPRSPPHPSGLSQCTSFECPVSCIKLALVICFAYGNMHALLLNHPTLTFAHIVQKSVLYIRVSFAAF